MRNQKEIEAQFVHRRWRVRQLSRQSVITAEDISTLDRIGSGMVAGDHWVLCDKFARNILLNHGHAHVRSVAACSERRVRALSARAA